MFGREYCYKVKIDTSEYWGKFEKETFKTTVTATSAEQAIYYAKHEFLEYFCDDEEINYKEIDVISVKRLKDY